MDDACDNDPDDWDLQWDSYGGDADVAYNCLYEYSCGETENIPEKMLMGIKDVIKENKLSDYDIEKSVCRLGLIDSDGQEDYILPNSWDEIHEMYMWYEELEDQNVSIIINAEEGDFFYNSNEVSIIEAPINQLKSEE